MTHDQPRDELLDELAEDFACRYDEESNPSRGNKDAQNR